MKLLGLVGLMLVVGSGLGLALGLGSASEDAPRASASTSQLNAASARLAATERSKPQSAEPQANPRSSSPTIAAASNNAGTTTELCGLGPVTWTSESDEVPEEVDLSGLPDSLGEAAVAQARTRLLNTLRQGGSPQRVAALLLDKPAAGDEARQQAWSDSVLREAQASRDPAVLSWAQEACAAVTDVQACRLGLVRARVQADPGNAVHWVALAQADPTSADEAWRGVLAASHWAESPLSWVQAAQSALPEDLPPYLRQALDAQIQRRAMGQSAIDESFLQERCQDSTGHRSLECDRLARLLLERGDSLHALTLGAQMAQAAGWPPEQLTSVQREVEALSDLQLAQTRVSPRQRLSCDSAERSSRFMADVSQMGELNALRARRTASTASLR